MKRKDFVVTPTSYGEKHTSLMDDKAVYYVIQEDKVEEFLLERVKLCMYKKG